MARRELGEPREFPRHGRLRPVCMGIVWGDLRAHLRRTGLARPAQTQRGWTHSMKPRHKRIAMIAGGLAAFQENLVFFFTPTQVEAKEVPQGRAFRVGGMVVPGSVKRQADGVTVQFAVTDTAKNVPVVYKGILPDLFKEGKGVVTQ